ncbi:MAG: hypothetical protein Q7S86_01665 [bacterium]|nr:hypothetical protein [bacterium]
MHEDVKWLFGLIIVFGLVWYVAGGFKNSTSQQPFIQPILSGSQTETYREEVISTGGPTVAAVNSYPTSYPTYGTAGGTVGSTQTQGGTPGATTNSEIAAKLKSAGIQAEQIKKELAILAQKNLASPLSGKISITNISRGGTTSAGEFITLRASTANKDKVLLTGLRLESISSGRSVIIGKGVQLPFQNEVNIEQPIYLSAGETVYILTGRSPLGISFRLNKCTGFFGQFQSFTPSIPSRCPAPSSEPLPPPANQYNDQCIDYINSLPICQVVLKTPSNISPECNRYVTKEISYTKCVGAHKNDNNFYEPEWRVYLNYSDALWKNNREIIHLLDKGGKIIDVVTY